jgi:hypothetical protein
VPQRQRGGGGRAAGQRLDRSRAAWRAREGPEERGLGRRSSWGRRVGVKCSKRCRGAAKNSSERRSRGTEERQRKKKEGRGSGDLFAKYRNPRGLLVNHNFP